jgi:hypothetical protein
MYPDAMATTNTAPAGAAAGKPLPFTVGEITKSEPPDGADTKNWYRYVITRGAQKAVVGHRQGSLKSVKVAVEEVVTRMNERLYGKSGRVHLTPPSRKRK